MGDVGVEARKRGPVGVVVRRRAKSNRSGRDSTKLTGASEGRDEDVSDG